MNINNHEAWSREQAAQAAAITLLSPKLCDNGRQELILPITDPYVDINQADRIMSSPASLPVPPMYSVNTATLENCVTEGAEVGGKISAVRRFFCLFVTFDLLFTTLLWLVCVVILGNFKDIIPRQILHCTIEDSLFDIVLCSLCRVVVLLLAYALWRLRHWWVVAITTAATSAYLIAKVFMYSWGDAGNIYTFSVILILCSFVIAWGESWFLDFRVLPQETRARELLGQCDVRSPLLPPGRAANVRYDEVDGVEPAPMFYSPIQSNAGSEDEDEGRVDNPQNREYKQKGKAALEEAWSIINSPGWKLEKECKSDTGCPSVKSKFLPGKKKVFLLTAIVNLRPRRLLDELYYQMMDIPRWNPTVLQCKAIHKIDNHTDVCYQVAADAAGGAISSRDFVNIRHWEMREEAYVCATVAVKHPKMPVVKKVVRGENGPGAQVMMPCNGNPNATCFQWLLNTDLKGMLPQYIIHQAMATAMLDFLRHLQTHVTEIKRTEHV